MPCNRCSRPRWHAIPTAATAAPQIEIKPCFGRAAETGTAVAKLTAKVWPKDLPRPVFSSFAQRSLAAAREVGSGNFSMRVAGRTGADEIGLLNRAFNRMTQQLERQNQALLGANQQLDERRTFIETVLNSVTAGVVSTTENGEVRLINGAAMKLLLPPDADSPVGQSIKELVPPIAELVGAQPVTVQAAEFTQALATGVVESTMTSGATGVDSKLYEHLKYYYDVQAWLPKNAVIANKKAFDALDKATQDVVMKAAADAEARGWIESRKVNDVTLSQLKANGMTVTAPSAQLKADMKKVGDTMLKEWLDKSGAEGKTLIDAYNHK